MFSSPHADRFICNVVLSRVCFLLDAISFLASSSILPCSSCMQISLNVIFFNTFQEGSSHDRGLYARCFEELFDLANSDSTSTSRFKFSVTVAELYNEQVYLFVLSFMFAPLFLVLCHAFWFSFVFYNC